MPNPDRDPWNARWSDRRALRLLGARRPRCRRGRTLWWLAVLVATVGVGLGLPAWTQAVEAARYPVSAADLAAGRSALDAIPVKGRAPTTGYDRSAFGQAWSDVNRNGCDTRNDILARDLTGATFKPETRDCVVLAGTLDDPYSGGVRQFVRGAGSTAVQIDHVVALADAWQKGAQQWAPETREAFANDPANLLAVDGPLNQEKGAGDAATWLPPNTGYRCVYVLRQVRVKAAYVLWVTAAERDTMRRQLDRCVVAEVGAP
ncbi:MAG: HNH endonuclease [Cellulomonas sp.]|uniref:HNH endonuclease family protein n=1 Tax=Cellulomonas sp. TaxID=40001 RepID=UPI0017E566C1|nr:HNH endonuclease family protein [Cellulomonas sp.]NMM32203.1 HNH endonuclease [Cellulomonas sp.]